MSQLLAFELGWVLRSFLGFGFISVAVGIVPVKNCQWLQGNMFHVLVGEVLVNLK